VVAYRTVEGPESSRIQLAAALDDGPIDALVLTSGSTVRGLLALAGEAETDERLRRTPVVAIGEPTAAVARSLGFTTVLAAPSPAAGDLAAFVASSLGFAPSSTRPSVLADTHTQPATYAAGLTPGGAR
jgi:uroporphyrinogen-III synthase/uroporphyrinogen III methyltransferase/synthase